MRTRLRTKLLGTALLYVVLLAVVGLLGLYAAQSSLEAMHVAIEHHVREVTIAGELASDVSVTRSIFLLHILSDSPDEQQRYERQIRRLEAQVDRRVDELEQTQLRFNDEDDIPPIEDFRQTWQEFVRVGDDQLLPLSREQRDAEAVGLTRGNGALATAYREVEAKLRVIQDQLPTESTERLQIAEDAFARNRNALFVTLLVVAVAGVSFGLWQSTRLARAIEALSRGARQVATGNLRQRVQVTTGDELESLADSFNAMTDGLQRMTERQTEQMRALSASEARFRSVTESVNEGIVSTDAHGQILLWNRGAQAVFGYREAEVLGRRLGHVLLGSSSVADEDTPDPGATLDPGHLVGQTIELFAFRHDRTEVPIELSVTEWTRGEETLYTATIRDVTERRAVERMKNEFVSMVSHELRTPLTGIIGMTDLLLRRGLRPQEREYVTAVRSSGEALQSIINDILDYSKIESGKLEFEVGALNVRNVVEDAVTLLAKQAHTKGLELAWLLDPRVPEEVGGDPIRLRQILLNLVGNAIKFTHTGEVVVCGSVAAEEQDSVLLRFEVRDTGIGIPDEARGRLFQAFSQADSSTTREYGGTGLGLAISKRLAELMGGEVGADSAPGRGSTFWFTARFVRSAPVEDRSGAPAELAGQRVLIVDDHPSSRSALEQQLAGWQLATTSVGDAVTALGQLGDAAAGGEPFALVLIDRHLGATDGLALARVIKASPDLAGARLVLLTWLGEEVRAKDKEAAGIALILEKPVRRARLLDAVTRLLAPTIAVPAASPARPPAVAEPSAAEWHAADSPRILLVEDTEMNQRVAVGMLRELGCAVEMAANGRQALDALADPARRDQFALVLMDSQMPQLDGYQTTAEIRRREAGSGRQIPIVAMTASAMQGDRERCLAAGMNDYLAKPVSFEQLAAMLRRWLPAPETWPATRSGADVGGPGGIIDNTWLKHVGQHLGPSDQGELTQELLEIFRREAPARLDSLRDAARQGDPSALQRAAHSLRGNADLLGATEVVELAAQLERLGRAGTTQGVDALLPPLQAAMARVCALEAAAVLSSDE